MNARRVEKYLRRYGVSAARPLVAASLEGITQAVVIPTLAERRSLFRTLASVARNPWDDLRRTLVICVVNNHRPRMAALAQILDNQETLAVLKDIVFGAPISSLTPDDIYEDLRQIIRNELRAAYIDASSPGKEIPDQDGGVGTARKIGMDAALELIGTGATGGGVLCCLDADTVVEKNYLSAVRAHFEATGNPAAVAAYAHQRPVDPVLQAAICCYEIFLRSYVMGLSYAGSPYAFHAIGSTIVCTGEGYVGVRGMNRRTAAEDFYFLNKLAKIGKIFTITDTTVFPSARISERVPFGTGRRMLRFMTGKTTDEYLLYDPRIFVILREWFTKIETDPDRGCDAILAEARHIHVRLEEYLRMSRFSADWPLIRKNCNDLLHLRRQFHVWFDGLKTLRLVHHLSRCAFPLVPMFNGLAQLIDLIGPTFPPVIFPDDIPEIDDQYHILATLRSAFSRS